MTAIRAACDHLKIQLPEPATTSSHVSSVGTPTASSAQPLPPRVIDIQSLRSEKKPATANEMATVVAFYLSELAPEGERRSEVETEDMVKYFKQARFRLPKQPRMLLVNAKNAGYFDSGRAGGYKLNAVGYNLVAHNLPRGAEGSAAPARRRKQRAEGGNPKVKKSRA